LLLLLLLKRLYVTWVSMYCPRHYWKELVILGVVWIQCLRHPSSSPLLLLSANTTTTRPLILVHKPLCITSVWTDDVKAEEKDEQADDSSAAYCTTDDGSDWGTVDAVIGVNSVC